MSFTVHITDWWFSPKLCNTISRITCIESKKKVLQLLCTLGCEMFYYLLYCKCNSVYLIPKKVELLNAHLFFHEKTIQITFLVKRTSFQFSFFWFFFMCIFELGEQVKLLPSLKCRCIRSGFSHINLDELVKSYFSNLFSLTLSPSSKNTT